MSMQAIFPRPDADGDINAFARHKRHPDGIPVRLQMGIQGGVAPFHYAVTGPAGMTIGSDLLKDWFVNRLQTHGVLMWANPTIGTHSITVHVTDQTGTTLDIAWDMVVSDRNDKTKFLFYAKTSGNNTTGDGSYDNPWRDDPTKAMGSSSSSNIGQQQVYYKEDGAYDIADHGSGHCVIDNTKRPVVFCAMPLSTTTSAAVTWNGTAGFTATNNYDDLFVGEITASGGLSTVLNWRWFDIGAGGGKRITYWRINFLNPERGTDGTDASTCIYHNTGAGGGVLYDRFVAVLSCTETGRTSGSASYSGAAFYGIKDAVIEDCWSLSGTWTEAWYLKDSCQNVTVRYGLTDGNGRGFSVGDQNQNGGTSGNIEHVWLRMRRTGANNYAWTRNHSGNTSNVTDFYGARCSVFGSLDISEPNTPGVGPNTLHDNVLSSSLLPVVPTGSQVTNTGTQCQGNTAWMDANFRLQGTYRTMYLKVLGCETGYET
jgi:hypothetical protein